MNTVDTLRCQLLRRSVQYTLLLLLVFFSTLEVASGQALSVPEMLEQRSEWDNWVSSDRKLQIAGRFEGRAGGSFRMQKLKVTFDPPRSLALPRRMLSGQRLEVSGRLENRAGTYHFEVSRLAVGDTDDRRLDERAARISGDQPALLLNLAAEYQAIAEFYNDADLRDRIASVRRKAFEQLRSQGQGDAGTLWDLVQQGKELEIAERDIDAVLFESLHTRHRTDGTDFNELSALTRKHLRGWDRVVDANVDKIPARYLSEPVAAYRAANDEDRRLMHRRFFRDVQKKLFRAKLRPDGSNGLSVAAEVRSVLPEEEATAAEFEQREIKFRLGKVRELDRRQLQQLVDLLLQYDRGDEIPPTLQSWLKRQEQRFAGLGLNGKLRTADEFLFVGDRWRRPQDREKAITLLKEAWQIADSDSPTAAEQIAERLRRLGWERMHDKWMTSQQVRTLPRDDVELAIREGRVVQGMTTEQVIQTLGRPASTARVISAVAIQELWSYGDLSRGGLVVRFRRTPQEDAKNARVVSVSGTTSGR